jgi:HAD superfamily hydrolase (TIGR01509 family)
VKAAIFDLDGTLVDSMQMWRGLARNYLGALGVEPPRDLNASLKGLALKEASVYIKQRFNLERSAVEVNMDLEKLLAGYYANQIQFKPHALEFLNELKSRSIPMVLATATDAHLASIILDKYSVKDYFKYILTPERLGFSKGQTDFFQRIVGRLGIDPRDIWVFEDALHCIESAKNCGLRVVAIKDKSALPDSARIRELSDIYLEDFSQLKLENLR